MHARLQVRGLMSELFCKLIIRQATGRASRHTNKHRKKADVLRPVVDDFYARLEGITTYSMAPHAVLARF